MRKVCASLKTAPTSSLISRAEREVVADRLLQHDARLFGDQAVRADVAADRAVEVGRGGEIEDAHAVGIEDVRQRMPVRLGVRRVEPDVAEAAAEPVGGVGVEVVARDVLAQRLAGALAVGVVVQVGARRGDDVRIRRHLAVAEAVVERRQQLAQRQVAGGAEHHAVEGRDGNDLRHGCNPGPGVAARSTALIAVASPMLLAPTRTLRPPGEAPPSMLIAVPVVKPA